MDREKGSIGKNRVIEFQFPYLPYSTSCEKLTNPDPDDGIIITVNGFLIERLGSGFVSIDAVVINERIIQAVGSLSDAISPNENRIGHPDGFTLRHGLSNKYRHRSSEENYKRRVIS